MIITDKQVRTVLFFTGIALMALGAYLRWFY
jgi:hypothetical protein